VRDTILSKVTVTSCSFYLMFGVSALLLVSALKRATALTNGAINETLPSLRHTLL